MLPLPVLNSASSSTSAHMARLGQSGVRSKDGASLLSRAPCEKRTPSVGCDSTFVASSLHNSRSSRHPALVSVFVYEMEERKPQGKKSVSTNSKRHACAGGGGLACSIDAARRLGAASCSMETGRSSRCLSKSHAAGCASLRGFLYGINSGAHVTDGCWLGKIIRS